MVLAAAEEVARSRSIRGGECAGRRRLRLHRRARGAHLAGLGLREVRRSREGRRTAADHAPRHAPHCGYQYRCRCPAESRARNARPQPRVDHARHLRTRHAFDGPGGRRCSLGEPPRRPSLTRERRQVVVSGGPSIPKLVTLSIITVFYCSTTT